MRNVTQQQADEARERDAKERQQFADEVEKITSLIADCGDLAAYSDVEALQKRIEVLIERASALGGNVDTHRSKLLKLHRTAISAMLASLEAAGKPDAVARLRQAQMLTERQLEMCQGLLGQYMRADTPITPDEFVPSLLTEDDEMIGTYLGLMIDAAVRRNVCILGMQILKQAIQDGFSPSEAMSKAKILERNAT